MAVEAAGIWETESPRCEQLQEQVSVAHGITCQYIAGFGNLESPRCEQLQEQVLSLMALHANASKNIQPGKDASIPPVRCFFLRSHLYVP